MSAEPTTPDIAQTARTTSTYRTNIASASATIHSLIASGKNYHEAADELDDALEHLWTAYRTITTDLDASDFENTKAREQALSKLHEPVIENVSRVHSVAEEQKLRNPEEDEAYPIHSSTLLKKAAEALREVRTLATRLVQVSATR